MLTRLALGYKREAIEELWWPWLMRR